MNREHLLKAALFVLVLVISAFEIWGLEHDRRALETLRHPSRPSCRDVPCQVTVYGGLLNQYGDTPLEVRYFETQTEAEQYSDKLLTRPDGTPNLVVTIIHPMRDCTP